MPAAATRDIPVEDEAARLWRTVAASGAE